MKPIFGGILGLMRLKFLSLHYFSPKVWILIALANLLLASGLGVVLFPQLSNEQKDKLYVPYDLVRRFMRDTVRLTFKTDQNKDAVFVAPKRILEQSASFKWVDEYQDFKAQPEDTLPKPKTSMRLLDPDWKPVFSSGKYKNLTQ